MVDPGYWIPAAALLVSIVALVLSTLWKPTFVSAATAADLRGRIRDLDHRVIELEASNTRLEASNTRLEQQNDAILREREWWQTAYREIKEKYDRHL